MLERLESSKNGLQTAGKGTQDLDAFCFHAGIPIRKELKIQVSSLRQHSA